MEWITYSIAVGGITLIFIVLFICAIELYKEHLKMDKKRNLELKGK